MPTLLYSIVYSIVAFPLTSKYVTLNNLECLFRVKFYFRFRTGLAGSDRATFEKVIALRLIKIDTY